MTRYTVTTPVKGFSGPRAGVMFHRGVAEVDDEDQSGTKALAYFARKGYGVEAVGEHVDQAPGKPSASASKADWAVYVGVAYADEIDPDQAADMTKAELQTYVSEREATEPQGDEE